MCKNIRVLVVDDSVIIRSRVSKILSLDPELQVAGVAANGIIALAKISQVNPDVIILDIEMPEMNGLETLAAIRKTYPDLPVIMFSTFTTTGAIATLDALSLGANDYATKPSNLGSIEAINEHITQYLVPKIKLFAKQSTDLEISISQPTQEDVVIAKQRKLDERVDVVVIGVSTGGPNALACLLPQLPSSFPVPILIVQHMPPMFTKLMAQRLAAKCQIQVEEGFPGAVIAPGQAWIAPGNFHLVVEKYGDVVRLNTNQAQPENSCRPAVDVLFNSVAKVYGKGVLAVVLTGMGKDGLRGCESIHSVGGQIIVQDKKSSVVWGMPGFVANAGLADKILPLDLIADEIIMRLGIN